MPESPQEHKKRQAKRRPVTIENTMFRHPKPRLAPFSIFSRRLVRSIGLSTLLVLATLLLGIAGYHWIAGLAWIDALLNASMIMGGMGPVDALPTQASKLFASAYALFCGLVMIGVMGLVLAPILHRMLQKFHLDEQDIDGEGGG